MAAGRWPWRVRASSGLGASFGLKWFMDRGWIAAEKAWLLVGRRGDGADPCYRSVAVIA